MKRSFVSAALAVLLLALVFGAAQAQQELQMAAVHQGAPVLVSLDGALAPLPAPEGRGIASMAWSPDGQLLALVVNDDNYNPQLFVTGPGLAAPLALEAGPLEAGFGVAFAPDGHILYAAQGVFPADFSAPPTVELRQIAPEAGAQPETLGQFSHVVGCGGGSPIPVDWQLWRESGFAGSYLTLQWTPLGIVHSTACSGGSTSIFDPATGADLPLGPTFDQQNMPGNGPISRLAISPDGTRAAAVRITYEEPQVSTSLVLIDLATGILTDVPTAERPDQLAWSGNDAIYYSTRSFSRDIAAEMDGKDRAALATAMGYVVPDELTELNAFTTGLHRLDLTTNADDAVLALDAYAIGRMREADDGTLVFSVIPNLDAWAQAIISGEYDPAADMDGNQARALAPVTLYQLPAGEREAQLIGTGLAGFELRPNA
jgi:hypothetical protein